MSELIDNASKRRELLKGLILRLHEGSAPDEVRAELMRLLGKVPYEEVVAAEQELIRDGLPVEEIQKLCDLHSRALHGAIAGGGGGAPAPEVPRGHPVDTFRRENDALRWELDRLEKLLDGAAKAAAGDELEELIAGVRGRFHALCDVEKHYARKENLLFPFLEKKGITGPSTVMWGKDDEIRALLARAVEAADRLGESDPAGIGSLVEPVLRPPIAPMREMMFKEEEILLPMSLAKLSDAEWYAIALQSPEIGFCLYDPETPWKPEGVEEVAAEATGGSERIQLPSGSLTPGELDAILNTIPFDLTFVDRDDTVRYFTRGRERIFARNRAILGRKVQHCHPPSSVHVVQKILDDFRAGREERAPFWIDHRGRFIHIEYFALRDPEGTYLGTLEVSQDLTEKRGLEGERRLLSYERE